jgi:hypothetical protein
MNLPCSYFRESKSIYRDKAVRAEDTAAAAQLLLLPPEIVLLISENLPETSTSCLALCSRRLSIVLGRKSWRSLKRGGIDERLAFLSLLARDLPESFVCQECVCLHQASSLKWPRTITYRSGPRCCNYLSCYRYLFMSQYEIYFPHIQLALSQHSQGIDLGFPLKAFQHVEVRHEHELQKTTLISIDAQIVSGEFLMRSQYWTLLPWGRRNEFEDVVTKDSLSFERDICLHTRKDLFHENVPELVKSRLNQLEAGDSCHTRIFKCPYCNIDYSMDARDFGLMGFAIVTTKWINMGSGQHYKDSKWKSHITRSIKPPLQHLEDVCESFEGAFEVSVDELAAQNELRLFSKRKARPGYQGPDGLIWNWTYCLSNWWYLAPSGPPDQALWDMLVTS